MKKILSLILALAMLLTLCVGLTSCADLADIAIDVLTEGIDETGETGGETDADEPPMAVVLPSDEEQEQEQEEQPDIIDIAVDEDGEYDDCDHVALYIHLYGKLPKNYMTKKEAEKLGWEAGPLYKVVPGKAIGGTYYGNYEGLLPKKSGRSYYECDIDTIGAKARGAKRIVYSNDGLVYYTEDHYETFTLLYGEE